MHWLERNDLLAFTSSMHDEPYVQYGAKAVEPPPGAREEWRIFVDLALAMRRPLFGAKGVNGFVKTTRRIAKITRRPGLEFGPHWVDRLMVATSRKVNGRKLKWRDVMSHPHGMVLGPREFGHFKDALRTDDKKVHAAPPEFVARARELLAGPHPVAPDGYPFQLANRRNRHAMNSWLNELPGLHPAGKRNDVVIHPDDAAAPRHQRRRSGAGVLPRRRDRTRRVGQRPTATGRGRRRPRLGLTDLRPARRRRSRSRTAPTATCSSMAGRWTRCRRRPR